MNTQRQEVRIEGGARMVQAPDGQHYVLITSGIMGATFNLPFLDPDGADQFADKFAENVHAVAAEVRRANAGLIVAGNGATGQVVDLNGLRNLRGR